MATITRKGAAIETSGSLPELNSEAPGFSLVKTDLSECRLQDFRGQTVILNIFPSIDTPTCANSVRQFNKRAAERHNRTVLCISPTCRLPISGSVKWKASPMSSRSQPSAVRASGRTDGVTLRPPKEGTAGPGDCRGK